MPKSAPTAGHTTSGGLGSQGELREQGGAGFSRGVVRAYVGAPGLWARRGEGFVASVSTELDEVSAERLYGVCPGKVVVHGFVGQLPGTGIPPWRGSGSIPWSQQVQVSQDAVDDLLIFDDGDFCFAAAHGW